ncbi:MAG: caspase family protein [Leptospiraceae bacterium]|nr:caspase family protein [Leptospiraceae bacterium]
MTFKSKYYFLFNSIVLITLLFYLPVYSQEKKGKPTKAYHIKSKGMKLTEIDEEGVPINNGKRYAIIIGINDYNDTAISDLSKARNDAKGIGKILKDIGQFDQVFVMTDDVVRSDPEHLYPTKLNIEEKIESVLRFTTPDDLIVFYFSGHGISDYDENGFLVTADTVADKKFDTSLRVDWIVKKFKEKKIKKSLLVLDACRDKLYTSKSSERDSIKEKIYTEAEVAATFYSTKSGYYSYEDDDSDYGVFTKNLIYGMEGRADDNNDGVVSFGELQQFVEKGVRDWSIKKNKQQKPFTKIYGERTGDLAITVAGKPEVSLADKKVVVPSRIGYVWRSALVPGWGQYNSGAKKRGISYFVISLGFLGLHASNMSKLSAAQSAYTGAFAIPGSLFLPTYMNLQNKKSSLEKAGNASMISLGLLVGFWIWNVIDAGVLTDLPTEPKTSGLQFNIERDSLSSQSFVVGMPSSETRNYVEWYWRF